LGCEISPPDVLITGKKSYQYQNKKKYSAFHKFNFNKYTTETPQKTLRKIGGF